MGPAFVLLTWGTLGAAYSIVALLYLYVSRKHKLSLRNMVIFVSSGAFGVFITVVLWGSFAFLMSPEAGMVSPYVGMVFILSLPIAALFFSIISLQNFDRILSRIRKD